MDFFPHCLSTYMYMYITLWVGITCVRVGGWVWVCVVTWCRLVVLFVHVLMYCWLMHAVVIQC